jgi:DNA-binding MarR family transcriptional regulator
MSDHYFFPEIDLFSSVPANFLSESGLTTNEKAFILCILKFFNCALIVPAKFSPKEVAELTGLNIKTVKKHLESIIQKGYLKIVKNPDEFQLTDKIDWNVYDHSSLIGNGNQGTASKDLYVK